MKPVCESLSKIILFGTGMGGKRGYSHYLKTSEIVGFCDNDCSKQGGLVFGRPVYAPEQLSDIMYDRIVVCSMHAEDIAEQLTVHLGIPRDKIEILEDSVLHDKQNMAEQTPFYHRWNYLGAFSVLISKWMPQGALAFCEWGAGYSTFMMHAAIGVCRGELLLSLDHAPEYMAKVVEYLPPSKEFKPEAVSLHDSAQLKKQTNLFYAQARIAFHRQFDLILVDGRARAECLLTAALVASEHGIVILDDAERLRYIAALSLFDIIDERLRFKVLRVKPEFKRHFLGFVNSLPATLEGVELARAARSPKGGMGFVPVLPPWSDEEKKDGIALAQQCCPRPANLFTWSSRREAMMISSELDAGHAVVVSDGRENGNSNGSKAMQVVNASLTGSLQDRSRDPNLHYSSAVFKFTQCPDFVVVAGHRPNECLLSAAFAVDEHSVVLVRDGDHPNLASGRYLFDTIDRRGNWLALRRKTEMGKTFETLKSSVYEATRNASITAP